MTRNKKTSRLTKALLETADDMRRVGILDAASHEQITLRHLGGKAGEKVGGAAGVQESVGVLGSSIFSTTSIRRYLLWPMRRQYARYFAISPDAKKRR